jgi:hypothetical protein
MLTQRPNEFGYTDVRLIFRLKLKPRILSIWNRFDYKESHFYAQKTSSILYGFPFDSKAAKEEHEVRIPGRILPEEIER